MTCNVVHIIMSQQNGFVAKFPKKVWCDFSFCHVWVRWWRCDIPHMTDNLAYFFCDSFEFTNSNEKIWTQPTTTTPPSQSCEVEPQKNPPPPLWWQRMQQAIAADISLATAHSGCCGCTNECPPPSNNTGLFNCCQGQGGGWIWGKVRNEDKNGFSPLFKIENDLIF